MSESINFAEVYFYDNFITGITVPTILKFNDKTIEIDAKIDTGASYCIFERRHGENLGIDIENGSLENFNTATGNFLAFGHELRLLVLGIETTSIVFFAKEESFTRNVLGRNGWLNRVKLGLIDYEGKLLLSGYNE